jgi:hypothetical protein
MRFCVRGRRVNLNPIADAVRDGGGRPRVNSSDAVSEP